jgi:hypothetical protein
MDSSEESKKPSPICLALWYGCLEGEDSARTIDQATKYNFFTIMAASEQSYFLFDYGSRFQG